MPKNRVLDCSRRKFRSETSDTVGSWKSTGGKSQGGEEKKWKIREEKG